MTLNLDQIGHMGWGEDNEGPAKTMLREKQQAELNYAAMPMRFMPPTAREPSPLEEKIKSVLQFDAGYAFWPVERIIYGNDLEPGPQRIGDCVGYSHTLLLASRIAEEIGCEGDYEDISGSQATSVIPHVGYSYGVGRVFVGNGRLRGDGSLCSWQIRGTLDYGFLPCDTEGLGGQFPEPEPAAAREFGRSRSLLEKWVPHAKPYALENSWDVESPEDLYQAIVVQRQPCQICSDWAFRPWTTKDDMQLYKAGGSWPHSMGITAMVCVGGTGEGLGNGGRWYVHTRNQWGRNAHREVGRGVPKGGFMITVDEFARWVRKSHCAAIGEIVGRQIDVE